MADQKTFKAIFMAVDKISAPTRRIQNNIKKIGKTTAWVGDTGKAMGVALTAGVTATGLALISVGRAFDEYSEQVRTSADKTGLSTNEFQRLAIIAEQSDVPVDALTTSFGKMNKSIGGAFVGKGNEATAVLKKMGINAQNFKDMEPETQFEIIANSLRGIKNPALQAVAANNILGKGFQSLMPLINEERGSIAELNAEIKRRDLIIGKDDLKSVDKAGDAIKLIGITLRAMTFKGIALAMPAIQKVINGLDAWLIKNKQIINIKIGAYIEKIANAITDWANNDGLEKLLTTFENIYSKITMVLNAVGGLKGLAIISAVMIGLGAVLPILNSIVGIIGTIAANWALVVGAFELLLPVVGIIKAILIGIGTLLSALSLPVILFIPTLLSLVAIVDTLYNRWAEFKAALSLDSVSEVFNELSGKNAVDFNAPNKFNNKNLLDRQKVDAGLVVRFIGAPAGVRLDVDNKGYTKIKTDVGYLGGAM